MFIVIFTTHWLVDGVTVALTLMKLIYAKTLYDGVNDALSILIITNLHLMASKTLVMDLSGYYNQIYNHPDYLQISMAKEEYKPMHAFGMFITLNMMFTGVLFLVLKQPLLNFITSISLPMFWLCIMGFALFIVVTSYIQIFLSKQLCKPFRFYYDPDHVNG